MFKTPPIRRKAKPPSLKDENEHHDNAQEGKHDNDFVDNDKKDSLDNDKNDSLDIDKNDNLAKSKNDNLGNDENDNFDDKKDDLVNDNLIANDNCKQDTAVKPRPPNRYAKLAAVTRMKNEILQILPKVNEHVVFLRIREMFHIYLERVENLLAVCDDENSLKWLEPHTAAIDEFRSKVEKIIYPQLLTDRGKKEKPSFDKKSRLSSKSSSASVVTRNSSSSVNLKIAREKARIAAEKKGLKEAMNIEKEMEALKNKQMKLKQQQKIDELDIYEKEINRLEMESCASSVKSCSSDESPTR